MFEHKSQHVLPRSSFIKRMSLFYSIAALVILVALFIGVIGYHKFAGYSYLDSLVNAAMILAGMGQVDALDTPAAKWFASVYALLSGLVFVTVTGLILAPILHRILHLFHVDDR